MKSSSSTVVFKVNILCPSPRMPLQSVNHFIHSSLCKQGRPQVLDHRHSILVKANLAGGQPGLMADHQSSQEINKDNFPLLPCKTHASPQTPDNAQPASPKKSYANMMKHDKGLNNLGARTSSTYPYILKSLRSLLEFHGYYWRDPICSCWKVFIWLAWIRWS